MKKTILISCAVLATLSLVAFTLINENKSTKNNKEVAIITASAENNEDKKETHSNRFSDFIYDIGTRFKPIKKSDVTNASSINIFFDSHEMEKIESVKSVELIIVEKDVRTDKRALGNNAFFNEAQVNFLNAVDYSTSFVIKVDYKDKTSTPHFTIVPEVQAEYIYGKDALVKYFIDNTKAATANIPEDKLKPAKLYFTVTKKGTIDGVHLDRSSGYPEVDKLVTRLISETPGGWIPATNSEGETVEQELVVSFGLIGC